MEEVNPGNESQGQAPAGPPTDADLQKAFVAWLAGLGGEARELSALLGEASRALERSGLPDTRALQALAMMVVRREN